MMCWPASIAVPILLKGCRRICRSVSQFGEDNEKCARHKLSWPMKLAMIACAGHIFQALLNVHVTLPNESVSPSLMGVALSGSRRLPLTRVEFVLFRSVSV